jgi:uncharacterized membrane protein
MFRVKKKQVENQGEGSVAPCLTWIRVKLVNEEGEEYADQAYEATLTSGQRDDRLDQNGGSWHRYIPPGQCQYKFSILEEVEKWQPPELES